MVILTILIAVATALIAPSIDMPDTVLREHHVASHSLGSHAPSTLMNAGMSTSVEVYQSEDAGSSSVTFHFPKGGYNQSSVVMRC